MPKIARTSTSWEEGYDLIGTGHASASLLSPAMTKAELAAYKRELKAKDAKRRPVGFAAWKEPEGLPLGGAVSPSKGTGGSRQGKTPPSSKAGRRSS